MAEASIPSMSEFREYLWLLARLQIIPNLRIQIDPSDIVQETLLTAQRVIGQFKGQDEAKLAAWLRTGEGEAALGGWLRNMLANTLTDAIRKLLRGHGEYLQSLESALEESSGRIDSLRSANEPAPGHQLSHFELLLRLAQVVARLPEEQRAALGEALARDVERAMSAQPDRTRPVTIGLLYRGIKRLRMVFERVISPC
jgi:RNA polymerase sigma-70 factor, ECF subfamily